MRYFLAFLATIGLLIILIILIISGGNDNKSQSKQAAPEKQMIDYVDTDAKMVVTTAGPINADSLHRQMQIHVSSSQVKYVEINGYNGDVVFEQSFSNTKNAFRDFLQALQFAGFNKGSDEKITETGRCALGYRYTYEIWENSKQIQRYWSTSCGGLMTFLGDAGRTFDLFEMQVPDYGTVSANLNY